VIYLAPVVIGGLILLDLALATSWTPWYFTTGWVVYRRRVGLSGFPVLSERKLQEALRPKSFWTIDLVRVRQLQPNLYAFRPSLMTGSSILGGVLELHRSPPALEIRAVARVLPLLVLCAFLVVSIVAKEPIFVVAVFLVLGMIAVFDVARCDRVLSAARQAVGALAQGAA
jgi:hypothetical protein